MTQMLRIDDIEEFEFTRRIPRSAIAEDILVGIRELDERNEIEIFLRQILSDPTLTPHTATEIADILCPLTYQGKTLFTAFINKGRASQKVTARTTSHQISKARRLPGVNLIVLLAVGNIQDDIKADLIQAAHDADADYMIVDAVDIARLFVAHHKICPKDGRSYVNGNCRQCNSPINEPIILTIKVYESPRHNILVQQENSHGNTKRYSADILTDSHYSKATLREIIKKVIWEIRVSRYYGSKFTEQRFGDRDADVVWVFVYFDELDRQTTNWICRARWVNSAHLPNNPFVPFRDEWLGDIEIEWRKNYDSQRSFWLENQGTKEGWIQKIEEILPEMERLVTIAAHLMVQHDTGQIDVATVQSQFESLEPNAMNVSSIAGNGKLPPLDCKECDQKFQNMAAQCHNIFIPFARWGKQVERTWHQKLLMIRNGLQLYAAQKQEFEYEWRKLRR